MAKLLDKLTLAAQAGRPVDVKNASLCLTADGAMRFVYDEGFGTLDAKDFENDIISAIGDFTCNMHWPSYFPNLSMTLYKFIWILPASVLERSLKVAVRPRKCLEVSFRFLMTYGRAVELLRSTIQTAHGFTNSSLRKIHDTA